MVTSTGFRVIWECYDPVFSELRIDYRLQNKDQCNALDETVYEQQITALGSWNREAVSGINNYYTHYADLSGLYPYSTYIYTVLASVVFQGQTFTSQSGIGTVTTSEDVPHVPPTSITHLANEATATTLTFTFLEITCGNRRGDTQYDFEIRYIRANGEIVDVVTDTLFQHSISENTVTVVVSNLQSGTLYSFRVRGINGIGTLPGPFSGGYIGMTSLNGIDDCASNPCVNGGCQDGNNEYTCLCEDGWTGVTCEIDINECLPNPCQNGAECSHGEGTNQYTCTCSEGWMGDNCDIDMPECLSDPCKNGGNCSEGTNQYTCTCNAGWMGDNCDIDINECLSNPCQNDAACSHGQGTNQYTCTCSAGWTGDNCNIDIDECASNPCVNGECQNESNQYICQCNDGWTGSNCDINIALPGVPENLQVTRFGKTFVDLEWKKPNYPNGIIKDYIIKYQAIEKPYEPDFRPNDKYTTVTIPSNTAEDVRYFVGDLEPSTKYEFRISAGTSDGQGEEAVIEVYTEAKDIDSPTSPNLAKMGPSVIIRFDTFSKYVTNVLIATEYVTVNRKKRQGNNLDGGNSVVVANLTRGDIDESMSFILGDNRSYGGYINNALVPGGTYIIRIAYGSCTPIEDCVFAWSPSAVAIVPDCSIELCEEADSRSDGGNNVAIIGGSVAGICIIIAVIIIAFIVYRRRRSSSPKESSTQNEVYDEIDPKVANQSATQDTTGYEVNLAMEVIEKTNQYEDEGLDYEDVNTERESAYQELDKTDLEAEHDYQGLGETDYQGLNEVDVDEHQYQGLHQNAESDRKTSAPYVNVSI